MRVLLDTHVLLWWDTGARLTREATQTIREADVVYVSAASVWEIEIKRALGKFTGDRSVADAVGESGFEELPVRFEHASALQQLPFLHRDPFDRLLAAQALAESLTLLTRDPALLEYPVRTIRA